MAHEFKVAEDWMAGMIPLRQSFAAAKGQGIAPAPVSEADREWQKFAHLDLPGIG